MTFDPHKIRAQFPILERSVYGKPMAYLDSAATSQKPLSVIETERKMYLESNANVHRGVHLLSEEATALYESARANIARFIGAQSPSQIVFTSGATASINLVAECYCRDFLRPGDNILVSEMEHHSNMVPWQAACLRHGAELRMLPISDDGNLRYDLLDSLIDSRTRVVAVTQASNTLGTCPELETVIEKAHAAGAVAVVDGCQGAVHIPTSVENMDCDFYAFSGHKLYGPTGIGVLYGKKELLEKMTPYMFGGEMVDRVSFRETTFSPVPLKFEAGTPNYVGAVALSSAVDFVDSLPAEAFDWEKEITAYAVEELLRTDGLRIYGARENRAPIVSFNIEGIDHYDLGVILDKTGVMVRTGHHCAYPVMQHYSVNGMCRASFAVYTTKEDVDALCQGVERAVRMLRR